jgi:aspartyl protease family protein
MKKILFIITITLFFLFLSSCIGCSSEQGKNTSYLGALYTDDIPIYEDIEINDSSIKITYTEMDGNTITIPVKINGMGLDMIFDTGASSTCITVAEAQYLYEKGKLTETDIIDLQQFQTADGTISTGLRINLRNVDIGDDIHLNNVEALVVENQEAPLLLGQSVMKKFREISIDRNNQVVKFFK